jgi:flagellum-specific peptidoglycan hydrolase FlgJ
VRPGTKPWWQQATALVTVSTGGVITGFTFAPGAAATMTSPTSMPLHLLALEKAANPADAGHAGDARLRSAIVNVASYYLQLAQTRTPAQMEALIWGKDSLDGADHGPTCAAFASLTLELAAQAVGQQSWVSGGTTYPWPLHEWADVRVDPNPDSLGITSILQDAQAHDRWHPLGDGYVPQPGDWVLFDGHVEVVTSYADGVLDSIGADSPPNLTVNAHSISGPLADQGVVGFVDNGHLDTGAVAPTAARPQAAQGTAGAAGTESTRGKQTARGPRATQRTGGVPGTARGAGMRGLADVPGIAASVTGSGAGAGQATGTRAGVETGHAVGAGAVAAPGGSAASGTADIPGAAAPTGPAARVPQTAGPSTGTARDAHPATAPQASGAPAARNGASAGAASQAHDAHAAALAAVPGVGARQSSTAVKPEAPYRKHTVPNAAGAPGTKAQQAFINQIAPGAMAAQQRYGVPASVTIAQAIDESNWGQSGLAAQDNNLFGIKGNGPAGAVTLPTQEYVGGQWETINASFRVYHNIAESIADHAELLATSGYYQRAMADRAVPDAFANDLTGVYATDPEYGANLIALMRLYNLYRFDAPVVHHHQAPAVGPSPAATHAYAGQAAVPGTIPVATSTAPTTTPTAPAATPTAPAMPTANATAVPAPHAVTASGNAAVPGIVTGSAGTTVPGTMSAPASTAGRGHAPAQRQAYVPSASSRGGARIPGLVAPVAPRYQAQLPPVVATAFFASAKTPLARSQPLYRDVASQAGIPWELLAACDWMQCQAHPRFSPVHGEKIGTLNSDGTVYMTKSEALAQCASDLVGLAAAVYRINLTAPGILSVRDLANAFAAFRWGGLLKRHRVSAMEFPYSVAGLTPQHLKMHWPAINDPGAPDKPGAKFRMAFGAVPVVLSLNYPATV